ncbi:hypothetical protein ILYODFUR_030383 [Ilyodon furcidens]|uniref:Uncharacterized protein n=1 Tax=Ilyodon furcidens TaxID=33524 RepID=A0ABV0TPQ9_9TELE
MCAGIKQCFICFIASVTLFLLRTTAERIIRADLPSIQDLYSARVREKAAKISADPTHPAHNLLAFYLQVGVTEHCLLKPATTETSFFSDELLPVTVSEHHHAYLD